MPPPPALPPSSPGSVPTPTASGTGDESFAKSLFVGSPAEGLIFPYPEPTRAEVDEINGVLDGIRRFAPRNVDASRIDREEAIPLEVLAGLRELGLFGLLVPKAHGGSGFGLTAYARVVQELAAHDGSLAMTVSAHQSLGLAALLYFGTEELKAKYLPRCARGESLAAFALVEVGAGSDAGSIQTRADRDGDSYVIDGEKIWVTNGGVADVFTVFARTSPAEDGAKPRLTAFVVERGAGVTSGPEEPTLGVRGASTTSLRLSSVRVPATQVLGDVGRGFKVAMEVLTSARLALASSCIGASKRLVRLAVERATERKTFGRTIAEFPLVKDKIAAMSAEIFALESMTYLTTGLVDAGRTDFSVESAICKVFGSETLWRVANESAQIAGALGYTRRGPWERMIRDARAAMVFEGTNEILRCFIALSGMQGPGLALSGSGLLEDVSKAMREPIKGFGLLSDLALRKARSVLMRDRLTRVHPTLAREAATVITYAQHLARSVDQALRRHGKNIAEMQYTQKRAADIAIDLYAISSCLTRTTRAIEKRGEEGARREIDLLTVFARAAEKRLAENVAAFEDNDDELRKAIAHKACADGGYPLDIL
ncbi:MAG: acyl-CoA dehydrogenase family protein [Labilithrix sp.]|nr:acyl-CoA dehydrogenase family protein [Labilithrix sp.]MCW5834250.1 acyl-CoA dehydrogenase family protein [Labilithrix sp.]